MIELIEIMRQKDDISFTQMLNRIRLGEFTDNDKEKLSERVIDKNDENYPHDALHIWAENKPVDEYNDAKLDMIENPLVTLIAHDEYPAAASQHDIQKALCKKRNETGGLDYKIKLKVDARVMLTTNLNIEDRLINGQMGKVTYVQFNQLSGNPQIICVKFDDSNAGKETIRKSADPYATENNVVPLVSVISKIKVKDNRSSSPEIKRTQFPLTLACSCTIHKVQSLTLSKVLFSFELFNQRQFNYGQVYVALSRVKSLEQLFIVGELDCSHIRADSRVHAEYDRLRAPELVVNIPNIINPAKTAKNSFIFTQHKIIKKTQC